MKGVKDIPSIADRAHHVIHLAEEELIRLKALKFSLPPMSPEMAKIDEQILICERSIERLEGVLGRLDTKLRCVVNQKKTE